MFCQVAFQVKPFIASIKIALEILDIRTQMDFLMLFQQEIKVEFLKKDFKIQRKIVEKFEFSTNLFTILALEPGIFVVAGIFVVVQS